VNERVILIGLDGGEPQVLRQLLPDCPNLQRLATEGAWGPLASTRPPLSPPAWATLMTGTNPGKHGVYDFFHMPFRAQRSYVRRLITSAHWRMPALWDRLDRHGRRGGFVNMPMCYPPPATDGFFVCGLGAPPAADSIAYPPALAAELAGVELEPGDGTAVGDPDAFLARCERVGATMLEVSERLWRANRLDLFCAALTFPDRFQHCFWRALERGDALVTGAYRRWFVAFDDFLGRVLDAAADAGTTVFLFSDHGFGPVQQYFHVNRWLLRRGYLHLRDASALGKPDGLLTAIDWERTRAYCLSEYGDLRLNLRGREPLGIVAPGAEADALLDALTADLRALDDGTPGPVATGIVRGDACYHGPLAGDGPDLLVRLRGFSTLCRIDGRGTDLLDPDGPLFVAADGPEHYRGSHRETGLLAAWGAGVERPAEPFAARAEDLCPTVLHLLELPLDATIDGRVLGELLAPPHAARAPRWEEAGDVAASEEPYVYDQDEEAAVTEQLRQLGYVE
jgi:predicted AlkP superfamily phosphohydrolase/phosphomutase